MAIKPVIEITRRLVGFAGTGNKRHILSFDKTAQLLKEDADHNTGKDVAGLRGGVGDGVRGGEGKVKKRERLTTILYPGLNRQPK